MSDRLGVTRATSPETTCLRRLKFGAVRTKAGEVSRRADYENDLGQRFRVTVRANPAHRAELREFTDNLLGSFEAKADDGAFRDALKGAEATKGGRRDKETDGLTIEMALVSPDEEPPMICGFYLDRHITKNGSPHRFKPDGNAVTATIYVTHGRARLRIFRGSDPTNRLDEATAGHYSETLGTQIATPRPHVRAVTDEADYDIYGGWTKI